MSSFKRSVLHGTLWSLFGQGGNMAVTFITNIILARLLTPYEFGQVGIIMFFIMLANVFTEGGLGGALVRKKEIEKEDYASVFVFNLIVSILCFTLLILFSGQISRYYKDAELQNLLIVAGGVLLINAFQMTQNAKMLREMKFKRKSIYTFVAVLLASITGVILAINGFGVWSMVIMQLLIAAFTTSLIIFFEGAYFSLRFNKKAFKELYGFGINTTLASLLNTAFDNIYQLIMGRFFSISQVGLFYQAKKLQEVPSNAINQLTLGVLFTSLSKLQEDRRAFVRVYSKIILLFTIVMGFITSFIYLYSESIILILYGRAWIGAVFFMKLLCIASFFYLQEMVNRIIFKVFNQTRKILYLEIMKKVIQAVSIVIGVVTLDLKVLIIGFVISSVISYFVNFYSSRKVLGIFDWYEVFLLLKVIFIATICVITITYLLQLLNISGIYEFLLFPVLILLYAALLRILKVANLITEFKELKNILKT